MPSRRGGAGHALVATELTPFTMGVGGRAAQSDARGMEEPAGSATTKEDRVLCAVSLQHQYGNSIGSDACDPGPAFTAGGSGKAALVSAFLAQHTAGSHPGQPARDAEEPVSTLTSRGTQQGVVAASMLALRGTSVAGRDVEEPAATLTAGGTHAGLILSFLQKYYGTGGQDQGASDPLSALTAKARHGLVTVNVRGQDYVIADIGMRMLEPEEGAAAHGFKPGSLPNEIEIDGKRRRLTKTEKYHLVGNSVPPEMVRLLAVHNVRPAFAEAAE